VHQYFSDESEQIVEQRRVYLLTYNLSDFKYPDGIPEKA